MMTDSDGIWNRLKCAALKIPSRSSGVVSLIGSTILILNGSMIVFMTAMPPQARRDATYRGAAPRLARLCAIRPGHASLDGPCDDLEPLRHATGTPVGTRRDERLHEPSLGPTRGGVVGPAPEMGPVLGPQRREDAERRIGAELGTEQVVG